MRKCYELIVMEFADITKPNTLSFSRLNVREVVTAEILMPQQLTKKSMNKALNALNKDLYSVN